MLLSISLNDARRLPQGSVRVELDWGRREWAVGSDQSVWRRVGFANRGPFEAKTCGVLWLWDQAGGGPKRNPAIVWDAPTGPLDLVHKSGGGRLFDPRDPKLKDGEFKWAVSESAAPAGVPGLHPIRQKVLKLCEANLPAFPALREPPNCLESQPKTKTASGGTGCGGFPGWVITQLGAEKFAPDQVKVTWTETTKATDGTETKVTKSATVNVTSPTIAWEDLGKAVEKRRGQPGTVLVPYVPGSDRRPKPGDIYLLKQPNGWFRHVGVVIDASGAEWRTADGGQGQGFAVGYRGRAFDPKTAKMVGEDKKDAYLKGWIDLEALMEKP